MVVTTGKRFNKYRIKDNTERRLKYSPEGFRGKFLDFIQTIVPFLRDDDYYNYRILNRNDKLRLKIMRDTNWLGVTTYHGSERHALPFHEQAIKYFEYKNMIIQRRAQYVIIFLTTVLLVMTALQIYLTFSVK